MFSAIPDGLPSRRLALASSLAVALAALGPVGAHAQSSAASPCTTVASVIASQPLSANSASGGKVSLHIANVLPPSGMSQAGQTLFAGAEDYDAAWAIAVEQDDQPECSNIPRVGDSVDLAFTMPTASVDCVTASPTSGACIASTPLSATRAFISFQAVTDGGGGVKWILMNAYPPRN